MSFDLNEALTTLHDGSNPEQFVKESKREVFLRRMEEGRRQRDEFLKRSGMTEAEWNAEQKRQQFAFEYDFTKGKTQGRFRYWTVKMVSGRDVRFCYGIHPNKYGWFLTWVDVEQPDGQYKRERVSSRRKKKDAKAICLRRRESFDRKVMKQEEARYE